MQQEQADRAVERALPSRPQPRRPLPAHVLADLRAAYAEEVADRLPRLVQAAAEGRTGPDVVRDAHSLGSSSFVVEEAEAGALARDVEARLLDGRPYGEQVQALAACLARWAA